MRLTLRTLLAYLDDLLDPKDAIEMGKRIEENKIATELVHRIRTRMRLLRLGAPKIEGKGIGVDPNSVAEYLDNSLPPDRVLDFEKVCLESDVHLAEVASCHQILAAILDKPAHVDDALRRRVYGLIHRGDAPPLPPDGTGPLGEVLETAFAPPISGSGVDAAPPQSSVTPAAAAAASPSPRLLPLALTLAVVFLFVLGGLRVLGPFNRSHPLAGLLGAARSDADRQVAQGEPVGESASKVGAGAPAESGTDDGRSASPDGTTGKSTADGDAGGRVTSGKGAPADSARPVDADSEVPGSGKPATPAQKKPRQPAASPMPDVESDAAAATRPAETPDKPAPGGSPAAAPAPPPNKPEPAVESSDEGPVEIGRFLSEEHVMARRNPDDNLWYRLARGTRLLDGDHLVSLPVYRPQLLLTTGVQVMLVGEASLRLKGLENGEVPELTVEYGRLLFASSGRPGATVQLNLAGQVGILRFADVDAEVAIEVHQFVPAGEDPLAAPANTVISISARKGKVVWKGGEEAETVIANGDRAQFLVNQPPVVDQVGFPYWSNPPSAGGLDRSASEQLAGIVRLDRPVTLSLGELAESRRVEVRSLAARCLGVLGTYDALWNELSNDKQYSYWDEAVDGLRNAIARSPEEASGVRKSIEGLRKRHSADLFRLLRGYDAQQLEQGGAAQLVDYLEHDDLDVRVLAFENLRRITESTHNYRPEKPAEARKIQIQEWRKQLKEGRVSYRTRRNPP